MSYNRFTDYHYKSSSLMAKDKLEGMMHELTNEYGYNFNSARKRKINEDDIYSKPKNTVNKGILSSKG